MSELFGKKGTSLKLRHSKHRTGLLEKHSWSLESLEQRHMLSGDSVVGLSATEVDSRIEGYRSYFDSVMASAHGYFLDLATLAGTNALHLYNLQFAIDGVLSMYEATGDRDVLDKAIEYVTNVMDSAEVIEGGYWEHDGFLDWELLAGDQPRPRREGAFLYDIQIGSAMSRLARILHEDGRLQADASLQSFGDQLVDFVDEQIIAKWLHARSLRSWLENFYDKNGYWADVATHTITVCHDLHQVLGNSTSCQGVDGVLAEQFRELLVVQSDASYLWEIWSTYPSGHHRPAPDTAHENRVATMMSRLAADEFIFDREDIHHLAKTFTQRIWNGRTDWTAGASIEQSPWFHNYIDGSDETYRNYTHFEQGTAGMNGFVYDGWVRLGQFDPEVQLAGDSLLAFVRAFSWNVNATRHRNGSVFGKVTLAGHLARNLRFAEYVDHGDDAPADAPRLTAQAGDANLDGSVTFADFLILSGNYGNPSATWTEGDFDGDRVVGFSDFLVMASHFRREP